MSAVTTDNASNNKKAFAAAAPIRDFTDAVTARLIKTHKLDKFDWYSSLEIGEPSSPAPPPGYAYAND